MGEGKSSKEEISKKGTKIKKWLFWIDPTTNMLIE